MRQEIVALRQLIAEGADSEAQLAMLKKQHSVVLPLRVEVFSDADTDALTLRCTAAATNGAECNAFLLRSHHDEKLASRQPPRLKPRTAVAERGYPLAKREELEAGTRCGPQLPATKPSPAAAADTSTAPKDAATGTNPQPAPKKPEEPSHHGAGLAQVTIKKEDDHETTNTPSPVSESDALPTSLAQGENEETVEAAPALATAATTPPQAAPTAETKQPTLFDLMKSASGSTVAASKPELGKKRARTTKTNPKEKKPTAKKAKKETGNSVAKLARASKNAAANAGTSVQFDEEEEENDKNDSGESSLGITSQADANDNDLNLLEVELTDIAENDDIIVCDDAPPMAFCSAEPPQTHPVAQNATPTACRATPGHAVQIPLSPSQPRLSGFLSPDVVKFQRQYKRDVVSDLVVENDEYISVDVVRYIHKETGETLTEEEYFSRSNAIRASSPSTAADAAAEAHTPSPAAAKHRQAPRESPSAVSRPAISAKKATPTLLSFFGKH